MKRQIRNGVFETNSSSTHSICIAKDVELTIPRSLHFSFGEFGWACDTLQSVDEKASYLYTGLFASDMKDEIEQIVATLTSKGIDVTCEEAVYVDGNSYAENEGYVDHANELTDFLSAVCSDEDRLMRYMFSDLSFIITGNDNDDEDVDINVDYGYEGYYKGN